jgi:uncharacterized protein (DUF58 family)
MWRISYRVFRAVGALIYWANRRLTAAGILVASSIAIAGAIGVDTTLSLAFQAFSLLVALAAFSMLCVPWVRARVSAERELPRIATAGEPFTYRLRVANLGGAAVDGLTVFEDFADPRPSYEAFRASARLPTYRSWKRLVFAQRAAHAAEQPLPALAPRGGIEVELHARALRRGVAHSDGVTVARADPLGLVKALTRVPRRANLIVLPRRYPLPPLELPGSRRYQPGGVTLAASVGDSEEFVGLRDYRPGDPLQRIHWKSFARAARPIVKEYQNEYFERHALVLDTFSGGGDERAFEEAVSIAASFAWTIDTQESLLDLMFVGAEAYTHTAGRGQLHAGSLLEILAGVQPCRDQAFSILAEAVIARRQSLTGCICVLLGWDADRAGFVRRLHSHGVAARVIAVSAAAVENPPEWLLVVHPERVREGLARL